MADLYVYRVPWTIPGAGPSISTFHFAQLLGEDLTTATVALRSFFIAAIPYLPNDVSISFPSDVSIIDSDTGQLVGAGSVPAQAGIAGSSTGAWAPGAGFRVDWLTPNIIGGRRVKGRTFFVPAGTSAYGTDGTVNIAARNAMNTAATALVNAAQNANAPLVVYSRPEGGQVGRVSTVTSGSTAVLAATLRGRKS